MTDPAGEHEHEHCLTPDGVMPGCPTNDPGYSGGDDEDDGSDYFRGLDRLDAQGDWLGDPHN